MIESCMFCSTKLARDSLLWHHHHPFSHSFPFLTHLFSSHPFLLSLSSRLGTIFKGEEMCTFVTLSTLKGRTVFKNSSRQVSFFLSSHFLSLSLSEFLSLPLSLSLSFFHSLSLSPCSSGSKSQRERERVSGALIQTRKQRKGKETHLNPHEQQMT